MNGCGSLQSSPSSVGLASGSVDCFYHFRPGNGGTNFINYSGAASKMAMENSIGLVRLEGRIHASLSESRERLLRMQVLRGVLNRERMLLRISAQERDIESLKKEQRRLQVNYFSVHRLSHSFNYYCTCSLALPL